MLALPLPFNIALEVLPRAIRQEKWIQNIQIGKEEIKLSLLADDMMLCAQNPNDATYPKKTKKNLLALINSVEDAKSTCKNQLYHYTVTRN